MIAVQIPTDFVYFSYVFEINSLTASLEATLMYLLDAAHCAVHEFLRIDVCLEVIDKGCFIWYIAESMILVQISVKTDPLPIIAST